MSKHNTRVIFCGAQCQNVTVSFCQKYRFKNPVIDKLIKKTCFGRNQPLSLYQLRVIISAFSSKSILLNMKCELFQNPAINFLTSLWK